MRDRGRDSMFTWRHVRPAPPRRVTLAVGFVLTSVVVALTGMAEAPRARTPLPPVGPDPFGFTRVQEVHLEFSLEAWHAIQPRRGAPMVGAPDDLVGPEGKRNGLAARRGVEFDYVEARVTIDGRKFDRAAVRYKGNGTFFDAGSSRKLSFKVDLNKFVKGQQFDGVTTLNLHSNVTDSSWMNEVMAYRLYRDAGVPAPRTAYARLFVTVPGHYTDELFGLYSLVENIDDNFAGERFGTRAGAIFKPVTRQPLTYLGPSWEAYNQIYDPKTNLTPAQKDRLLELCHLVTHASDDAFIARLGEYLDIDAFAQYLAVTAWLANPDSLLDVGQNYYLYLHPTTGRFLFIPWDQDAAFGQSPFIASRVLQNMSISHPWTGANRFLERIFSLEAFRQRYIAALRRFTGTVFTPERVEWQVQELARAIRPAVHEESVALLPRFDAAAAGRSYEHARVDRLVIPIRPFAVARTRSVAAQLSR